MKTINQIAIECGVTYEQVYRTIKNIGMVLEKGNAKRLDEYQEDIVHGVLFLSGFTDTLIFESKMNAPEIIQMESFEKFKKRTYGKAV